MVDERLKRLLHSLLVGNLSNDDRATAKQFLGVTDAPWSPDETRRRDLHDAAVDLLFQVREAGDDTRPVWVTKAHRDEFFAGLSETDSPKKEGAFPTYRATEKSRDRLSHLDNVLMDLVGWYLAEPAVKQEARVADVLALRDKNGWKQPSKQWALDRVRVLDQIFKMHEAAIGDRM